MSQDISRSTCLVVHILQFLFLKLMHQFRAHIKSPNEVVVVSINDQETYVGICSNKHKCFNIHASFVPCCKLIDVMLYLLIQSRFWDLMYDTIQEKLVAKIVDQIYLKTFIARRRFQEVYFDCSNFTNWKFSFCSEFKCRLMLTSLILQLAERSNYKIRCNDFSRSNLDIFENSSKGGQLIDEIEAKVLKTQIYR